LYTYLRALDPIRRPLLSLVWFQEQLVGRAADLGEGWHNNHQAHPTAARHGLAWYEIDIQLVGIRFLQFLGLARSIKFSLAHRFLA